MKFDKVTAISVLVLFAVCTGSVGPTFVYHSITRDIRTVRITEIVTKLCYCRAKCKTLLLRITFRFGATYFWRDLKALQLGVIWIITFTATWLWMPFFTWNSTLRRHGHTMAYQMFTIWSTFENNFTFFCILCAFLP